MGYSRNNNQDLIRKNMIKKIADYPYLFLLLTSLLQVMVSYVAINTNSQIYDYPFHMARIVGLAQSIANGDFLPNLNYLFTHGSGYAVPMFYGNAILYIPALIYLLTKMGTYAFASYAFIVILLTSYTSYYSLSQITGNKERSLLFGVVMATVFPYFGFGMTVASAFIPFLLYCIYKVLYLERLNPIPLGITVALLVQTHIISTVVLAITSVIITVLLLKLWTIKKIKSFLTSIVISIGLSIGFIVQYLEQNKSQTFFVSWGLRSYPFPTETILNASDLMSTIENYSFPLTLIFLLLGIAAFKFLKPFARILIFTSVILFLASTSLLPWYSVLRYTFLTVFQYTSRLTYFLPALVLFALFLSSKQSLINFVAGGQIVSYILLQLFVFTPESSPYKEEFGLVNTNIEVMRIQNEKATTTYYNPYESTYWTSGGEYLNLTVNHDEVQDGTINQFIYDENKIKIENINQTYNNLEFDVTVLEENEEVKIVLPRIWYKGYAAIYSEGISGSQPSLLYVDLTEEELLQYEASHKPSVTEKALYNGQAMIIVSGKGRIRVTYRKTVVQIVGFIIQLFVWVGVLAFGIGRNRQTYKLKTR